jgi:hypothetical protein
MSYCGRRRSFLFETAEWPVEFVKKLPNTHFVEINA